MQACSSSAHVYMFFPHLAKIANLKLESYGIYEVLCLSESAYYDLREYFR